MHKPPVAYFSYSIKVVTYQIIIQIQSKSHINFVGKRRENRTAILAVELILSALGKTTL